PPERRTTSGILSQQRAERGISHPGRSMCVFHLHLSSEACDVRRDPDRTCQRDHLVLRGSRPAVPSSLRMERTAPHPSRGPSFRRGAERRRKLCADEIRKENEPGKRTSEKQRTRRLHGGKLRHGKRARLSRHGGDTR